MSLHDLKGIKQSIEKAHLLFKVRHEAMLAQGYRVCPMCNVNYTQYALCAKCLDILRNYKKLGRLPRKLIPFAIAAGMMKKTEGGSDGRTEK